VLNAAGIAAPVLWVAALVYIGSLLRPEYSHYGQYISELAAPRNDDPASDAGRGIPRAYPLIVRLKSRQ
jgi:hypothetical protein